MTRLATPMGHRCVTCTRFVGDTDWICMGCGAMLLPPGSPREAAAPGPGTELRAVPVEDPAEIGIRRLHGTTLLATR